VTALNNRTSQVLVTGGAGFIGRHLVRELLNRGFKVRVLDNFSSGASADVDDRAELREVDLRDRHGLASHFQSVDCVYHLAAMSRSGPSDSMVHDCVSNNVMATVEVLEAARLEGVRRLVYAASATCYGMARPPHKVNERVDLMNPYGWSKYAGEEIVNLYSRRSWLETVSLRLFSVYGPGQPEEGEYSLVLGRFLRNLARDKPHSIHGDGRQRRDFIHVFDVVHSFVQAGGAELSSDTIFNVGSGISTSVLELAELVGGPYEFTDPRPGDALETLADISNTVKMLNWRPTVSIETGIRDLQNSLERQTRDE